MGPIKCLETSESGDSTRLSSFFWFSCLFDTSQDSTIELTCPCMLCRYDNSRGVKDLRTVHAVMVGSRTGRDGNGNAD